MKFCTVLLVLLTVATTQTSLFAQEVNKTGGKPEVLKRIDSMNIEFDYSKLTIGEIGREANYIKKKKDDYNKKEPGRGDNWEIAWYNDRPRAYEPKFIELFNKYSEKPVVRDSSLQYTLIFKVTNIEPGFNIGIKKKKARVTGDVWIVETTNRKKALLKYRIEEAPGGAFSVTDFDSSVRISEGFATAGRGLAKYMAKNEK
jgi:hypothetical protein